MSILIKGMEMPTSCEKCPFLDYEEGFCFASGVKHESGWYESTLCPGGIKDGRHEDCPLVPVPPHGDLIDRDALMKILSKVIDINASIEQRNEATDQERRCLWWFEQQIGIAPTIIPAEEGE